MIKFKKKQKAKKIFNVEAYGKLPIYNDYIDTVFEQESVLWSRYLQNTFDNRQRLPDGLWPFIYLSSIKSNAVVGIIEQSSDGSRQFPFCVFTVQKNFHVKEGIGIIEIWKELECIRTQIKKINDINNFYEIVQGKTFHIDLEQTEPIEYIASCVSKLKDERDIILLFSDLNATKCILESNDSFFNFIIHDNDKSEYETNEEIHNK